MVRGRRQRFATVAVLSVMSLPTLPNALGAQQRQKPPDPFSQAIVTCAASVRDESDRRAGSRLSDFDAYVKPGGTVTTFGTPAEQFRFEKCMNESGSPIIKDSK